MPDEPIEDYDEATEEELELRLRRLLGDKELADSEELDEIEAKLLSIEKTFNEEHEARKEDDVFFDKEFDAKFQHLHDKVEQVKANRTEVKKERFRQMKSDSDSARGAGVGLSVAYTIIGLPLVGAGLGWLVQRATGFELAIGLGTVLGLTGGIAMAMVMMNRTDSK